MERVRVALALLWTVVAASACESEISLGGSCTPLARVCSKDDVLVCTPDGSGYEFLKSCPAGCDLGDCLEVPEVDAPEGEDVDEGPSGIGCPGCPCSIEGECDPGLVCLAGFCIPPGCQQDSDCPPGERCYLAACIPEKCGDGNLDNDEQCDDGNNRNLDGCNVNCDVEPTAILPGGKPLGFTDDPSAMPVAYGVCTDETTTAEYAPGPMVGVALCVVSYLDKDGYGMSAAEVAADVAQANNFHAKAKTGILLELAYTDIVQGSPDQSAPDTDEEINSLLAALREFAEAKHPGQCQVVVGYVLSLKGAAGEYGGMGVWPSTGLHSALVTRFNAKVMPGQTLAHETGHVFGLHHTHEGGLDGGDECLDTAKDSACFDGNMVCEALCPDGSKPPAHNVMSYYNCDKAFPDSFTACQARRARCFISHMFEVPACPLPVLLAPTEEQTFLVGQQIVFKWKPGNPLAVPYLIVRSNPPSGPIVLNQAVGQKSSFALGGQTLGPGQYAWTVRYFSPCCPDGECAAVEREFTVAQSLCQGPSSQSCGMCGTQTRKCKADGTWEPWGSCQGEGVCSPGTTKQCPGGGPVVSCSAYCLWPACPACQTQCAGKCPGQDDGCGGTCQGNSCAGCCSDSMCLPGTLPSSCGSGGMPCLSCASGASCQAGICSGCPHDGGEPNACGNNDTLECAWKYAGVLQTQQDKWYWLDAPATMSPVGDVDYFLVKLEKLAFFGLLDPEVRLANPSGLDLEVCAWWHYLDGTPLPDSISCSEGSLPIAVYAPGNDDWYGALGCCLQVPPFSSNNSVGFSLDPSPGELLIRVSAPNGGASCAIYGVEYRM